MKVGCLRVRLLHLPLLPKEGGIFVWLFGPLFLWLIEHKFKGWASEQSFELDQELPTTISRPMQANCGNALRPKLFALGIEYGSIAQSGA